MLCRRFQKHSNNVQSATLGDDVAYQIAQQDVLSPELFRVLDASADLM